MAYTIRDAVTNLQLSRHIQTCNRTYSCTNRHIPFPDTIFRTRLIEIAAELARDRTKRAIHRQSWVGLRWTVNISSLTLLDLSTLPACIYDTLSSRGSAVGVDVRQLRWSWTPGKWETGFTPRRTTTYPNRPLPHLQGQVIGSSTSSPISPENIQDSFNKLHQINVRDLSKLGFLPYFYIHVADSLDGMSPGVIINQRNINDDIVKQGERINKLHVTIETNYKGSCFWVCPYMVSGRSQEETVNFLLRLHLIKQTDANTDTSRFAISTLEALDLMVKHLIVRVRDRKHQQQNAGAGVRVISRPFRYAVFLVGGEMGDKTSNEPYYRNDRPRYSGRNGLHANVVILDMNPWYTSLSPPAMYLYEPYVRGIYSCFGSTDTSPVKAVFPEVSSFADLLGISNIQYWHGNQNKQGDSFCFIYCISAVCAILQGAWPPTALCNDLNSRVIPKLYTEPQLRTSIRTWSTAAYSNALSKKSWYIRRWWLPIVNTADLNLLQYKNVDQCRATWQSILDGSASLV